MIYRKSYFIAKFIQKKKDILFINLAFFISDYYFKHLKEKNYLKMIKFLKLKIIFLTI